MDFWMNELFQSGETVCKDKLKRCVDDLWKKEEEASSESPPLYVDLIDKSMAKLVSNAPKLQRAAEKSNVAADKHRSNGNQLFHQKNWTKAIEEYNKSLCYAVMGSESMSLAYANRSSCYFHLGKYDNCLTDIELAIKSNYPHRLMPKLEQRKADCLEKQAEKPCITQKLELSYPANASIPWMADVLEIRRNDDFGLHIVATCDIPVGQTILIEPQYISSSNYLGGAMCSTCERGKFNLMPCERCTSAMFCSAECVSRSRVGHAKECGYTFYLDGNDQVLQYLSHSIMTAIDACGGGVDELMAFVESVRKEPVSIPTSTIEPLDRYRTFLQLHTRAQRIDMSNVARIAQANRFMTSVPEMAILFDTLAKRRFLTHLLVMHEMIVSYYCFQEDNNSMDNNSLTMGLIMSLFKHQCLMNIFHCSIDGQEVAYTVRPVKKGEQLYLSYNFDDECSSRQYIYDKFGFWCQCSKCVPVALPAAVMQSMKQDEDFLAMRFMGTTVAKSISINPMIKEHCISFLNKYGHLPYNKALEYALFGFIACIYYDCGRES